jgi:isopenicillin N synthase-like dioxygenase
MENEPGIPTLDLEDFVSNEAARRNQFMERLGTSLSELGFFLLVSHGVSRRLIERSYALAERFFELPDGIKQRYAQPEYQGTRGYTVFRPPAAAERDPAWKESWNCGPEVPAGGAFADVYPPNRWPEEVRGFRGTHARLFDELESCAMRILDACSVVIEKPWRHFRDQIMLGNSQLRVLHYPALPAAEPVPRLRARGHEDLSLITLLCAPTAEGLEVLDRHGRWQPVASAPGTIVVNAGQMIHHVTGGLFRSAEHRVMTPPASHGRRFSIAFFVQPRSDADLTPTPETLRRMGAPLDPPSITAGEFFRNKLQDQPSY